MWQVALAAAVAGSGFFAKRFLNTTNADPNVLSQEAETKCDQSQELQQQFITPSKPQFSIPLAFQSCNGYNSESEMQSSTAISDGDGDGDGSIFMFSSSVSRGGTGSRFGEKSAAKKSGNGYGRNRGNAEGFGKVEKKCGGFDQSRSGRKFAVCLKKRRTSKNAPGKCESCSSKDNSTFSWGLGVGIMCMISAGKTEISRLNMAMDETAKVVQELKTEFSRRKSLRNLQVSSSKTEIDTNPDKIRGKKTQPIPQSSTENGDNVQDSGLLVTEEGECASSVLTEEPQQEVLEMDRLEAELESELQKLPWCSTEASGLEGRISDICVNDASSEGFYKPDGQTSDSYQLSGVLPSELDQKLCHLLIEQQESQIVGLESELHQAQSKLHEKETELQALKDCVKRLTEFSLATASDEESEAQKEEEKTSDHGEDYDIKMGPESKRSMVGMKRSMDFEPYSCHMK